MDKSLLLIIIILILFFAFVIFYLNMTKTEKFNQCRSFQSREESGLCAPYYGIPAAVAIHPGDNISNLQARKDFNKEAARMLCNKTPGCKGVFQNQSTSPGNDKHEAYLCKPEFNGTSYITDSGIDFKTYLCDSKIKTKAGPEIKHGNKIMLLYNLNGTYSNYTREFTQYNHYKYDNYRVNDEADYIRDGDGNIIEEDLELPVGEFEANHLNRLFEFVRSYQEGIGFEVSQVTTVRKKIRFFKKRHSYSLLIKPESNFTIYSSIISNVIERPFYGYCHGGGHRGNMATVVSGNDNSNWPYLHHLWKMIRDQDGYFIFFGRQSQNSNISAYFSRYAGGTRQNSVGIGHFQDGVGFNYDYGGPTYWFNYLINLCYIWIPTGPINLNTANNTSITGFVR